MVHEEDTEAYVQWLSKCDEHFSQLSCFLSLSLFAHLEVGLYFLFQWNLGMTPWFSLAKDIWASDMCRFQKEG